MRACKDCEYYKKKTSYMSGKCYFNPPMLSGEHQDGKFPEVGEDDYCSKWEPMWDDNPMISKAWKEFQTMVKLSRGDEE